MKRVFRLAGVVVLALIAMGCATSHTTLVRPDLGGGQVIYRISEEQAFTTALEAYAVFLPKQSVDDVIDGSRRGYSADERWGLDYWTHRTLVIPAVGTDANGNEVRGYWYEISGSGTLIPLGDGRTRFLRFFLSRLEGTGTATVVTNVRDGSYETDGRAYLGLKRDARDIKLGARSPEAATADRLSELKSMRDKGLITEEEYQAKRRQILDRM
jgi:hypothetical protein